MNPLTVIFLHLAVADTTQGISVVINGICTILFDKSSILFEINEMFVSFHRYLFAVSIVTLVALTYLKMKRITENKCYTKHIIRRLCFSIWVVVFTLNYVEYSIYKCSTFIDIKVVSTVIIEKLIYILE